MAVVTLHLINNDIGPQTIKTRATDVFQLQSYIYPKSTNAGGGSVALALNCTDSRGINGATTVVAKTETVPATGSWSQLNGYATVPTGYDTVDPVLTLTSVPVTDIVYVDDVMVREVTYAQQIMATVFGTSALPASSAAAIPPANIGAALDQPTLLADVQALATSLWGSATSQQASSNTAVLQNIADAMHQVTFGGAATNTPMDITTLKAMFAAQPASTVVPPPNPSSTGAIAVGTVGSFTANLTSGGHYGTAAGTHTPAAADNYVIFVMFYAGVNGMNNEGMVYGSQGGGQNVTLGSLSGQISLGNNNYAEVFGGFITPGVSGAQTLSAQVGGGMPTSMFYGLGGYSRSFSGVVSVGAVTTSSGSSGNPAQTVVSAANDYILQSFWCYRGGSTDALSAFTGGTVRYTSGAEYIAGNSDYVAVISGDAPGAASVAFGATQSNAFGAWCGIAINLVGATVSPIGSGFHAVRTSTTAYAGVVGNSTLPASVFPAPSASAYTSDYTYVATTNTVTVANSGWYAVNISLGTNSGTYYNQYVRVLLYHNGGLARTGQFVYLSGANSLWSVTGSFIIYCNAGDTLTPGQYTSLANASVFVADAAGTNTYFDVTLMNRSLL